MAKDLGDEKTLGVYKYLLKYTSDIALAVNCHRFVFYSGYVHIGDSFDDNCFTKFVQEGETLGARMELAFNKVFAVGHQNICIIGSDCYQLQPSHIHEGFEGLKEHDLVIGPATDGGYYLIGMKQTHSFLFQQKDWGTSSVFDDSITDLTQRKLTWHELEQLNDVDTVEDLMSTDILVNLSTEPDI